MNSQGKVLLESGAVVLNLWVTSIGKHGIQVVLGTTNHKLIFVATS